MLLHQLNWFDAMVQPIVVGRQSTRLGSVAPGKLADLLLVAGDPIQDIQALRQVRRVMLNGRWVSPSLTDQAPTKAQSP
jgi:hypothetical protein